ncbi:MAG: branched-chain amino acid ABC transporter permease [Thermodesulfobacteriota bacterium]
MNRTRLVTWLCLLGAVVFPLVVEDLYFMHMAILIGIYALSAISVNLVLGFAGQLSLGQAAFFGVGAYISALVCLHFKVTLWGGLVAAIIASGIMGYIVAKLALKLRGAYFVIMTIGVCEVLKLIALNWVDLTKGPMGLTNIAAPVLPLGPGGVIDFGGKTPYYYLVLISLLLCLVLQSRLVRSPLGRAVVSIRENEDLARSIGINCYRYLVIIVVISAGMAGFSGALYAHYVSFIDPGVFAFFISVNLVMMVVGGGQGTFMGPVVGAVLFTSIPELLRVFGDARMAVYSLIVIFIVIFMPKGILFYLSKLVGVGRRETAASPPEDEGGEGAL